jgi:MSHA pilin protein MshC
VRHDGFTLIELIVVIVLVGIVALIAAPRFFTASTFDASRFHEAAISAIRYAQKVAVAQHTDVYVVATPTSVALCYDAGCATAVPSPADGTAFVVNAPAGIGITAAAFNFTALGAPNGNIPRTLIISGDVARQIVIEQETGYVHR